jgi:3-hydroxyacyl-CoA dehydrogenase
VHEDDDVRIWHSGDDVLIISLKTKMHVIGPGVIAGFKKPGRSREELQGPGDLERGCSRRRRLLGRRRPAIGTASLHVRRRQSIDPIIRELQDTFMAMKYANVPVVAAVAGLALGGGCEMALHASKRVASIESYIGLVEVGVGLIPAGGGLKEAAARLQGSQGQRHPAIPENRLHQRGHRQRVEIGAGSASDGLPERRRRDRVQPVRTAARGQGRSARHVRRGLPRAAEGAGAGDRPLRLGTIKAQLVNMRDGGFISAHDFKLGDMIAEIVSGGDIDQGSFVSEQWLLDMERKAFWSC